MDIFLNYFLLKNLKKQNKKAWEIYLDGVKDINKYVLPLLENDFSCLPPCFSFVGIIDPFYEETKEYISKLKKANVDELNPKSWTKKKI